MTTSNNYTFTISLVAIAALAACSHGGAGSALPTFLQNERVAPDAASFQSVYSFKGQPDGNTPNADLIAAGGTLVGTTAGGGANDVGTVFRLTPAGAETVLFSFASGSVTSNSPDDGVIDVRGEFFGTTNYAEFAVNAAGEERVLHQLAGGRDGDVEQGPLVYVKGEFYGATQLGGIATCNSGCGTVYAVTPAGTQHTVYRFRGKSDGFEPQGGLISVKGELYGTTSYGGTHDAGTVYRVTSRGSKQIVYDFTNQDDGTYPTGKLAASKGMLYVSARYGGAHGYGTILEIAPSGKATVIHGFAGGPDGQGPNGGLVVHKGVLYGTTAEGGRSGKGTIFALTRSGKKTTIYDFHGGADGASPLAGLAFMNGMMYGTTFAGGSNGKGTVFRFRP